jgi:NarL family two-component system sensor histidine kinase LiaS
VAWLRMKSTPQSLIVIVEDTGKGFAPASIKRGNGLENYRERMKTCGGTVSLITAPGEGTRLEFRIPLPPPPV